MTKTDAKQMLIASGITPEYLQDLFWVAATNASKGMEWKQIGEEAFEIISGALTDEEEPNG